jgi:hypothetical protein
MESRVCTLLHPMGIITVKGENFNELKLSQLIEIAEQLDIVLDIDDVHAGWATSRIALQSVRDACADGQ